MKTRYFAIIIAVAVVLFSVVGCTEGPHEWADGVCVKCGQVCKHDWDDDEKCKICGIKPDHTREQLNCTSENGNIFGSLYLPSVYHGKLKTVILCHGFGVNAVTAMPVYLARRGYACYAFDFCGGSTATRSDMAFEDMTIHTERADLLAVFDMISGLPVVDADNIFLYGESQGGLVCSITAVELADKIAGMILMYPGFSAASDLAMRYGTDPLPEYVNMLNASLKRGYAEAIYEYLPETFTVPDGEDEDEIIKSRLELTSTLYEYVSAYEGKTVIFHGTEDALVNIAFSDEAIKYYKNARLYHVAGEGHGFGNDAYMLTVKRIDAFLRSSAR